MPPRTYQLPTMLPVAVSSMPRERCKPVSTMISGLLASRVRRLYSSSSYTARVVVRRWSSQSLLTPISFCRVISGPVSLVLPGAPGVMPIRPPPTGEKVLLHDA
ncbi:hypothetical protein D3C80_1836250 [compost metagenome]